jgi:DNA processing protein
VIDIEAHRNALQIGLPTSAVMGFPIGPIYPAVHKKTAQSIMETGCVISEYLAESKMRSCNFPARNRSIASLSDLLMVVEAAEKGGALILLKLHLTIIKMSLQCLEICNLRIAKTVICSSKE